MEQIAEEEVQDIGLAGRMVGVFYAPSETFEAVRRQSSWLDWFVPVLLVALLSLVMAYITMPIIMQTQAEQLQERLQDRPEMSEEQLEMVAKMQGVGKVVGLVTAPIGAFVVLFVIGAVLLLLAKVILGAEATYGQMLAVVGYASLIGIISMIVRVPLMLAKETAVIHMGPGVLVSEEMGKTFLGRLLAGIDLFTFWEVCIMGIGIAVIGTLSKKKAIGSMLVLWVIWVFVKAGLGGFGAMLGQGG